MAGKDQIFSKRISKIVPFEFDKKITEVFDDMVQRSVPFYGEIQRIIADLALDFYQADSLLYDLGSSTGATALALQYAFRNKKLRYIGIDSSEEMTNKARTKFKKKDNFEFLHSDLTNFKFKPASVMIANLTLQFIEPKSRLQILKSVYEVLNKEGLFIITEKVIENSEQYKTYFENKHYAFKKKNHYSDLEISQKRDSLMNRLRPFTSNQYIHELHSLGFSSAAIAFKWFNFVMIIAQK